MTHSNNPIPRTFWASRPRARAVLLCAASVLLMAASCNPVVEPDGEAEFCERNPDHVICPQ